MTRTARLLAIAVAALAIASTARADDFTPVPASQLKGRTLVLDQECCTLEAPSDDWRWVVLPHTAQDAGTVTKYACLRDSPKEIVLLVCDAAMHSSLDENTAKETARKMAAALGKNGGISNEHMEQASVPVAGESYRFTCDQAGERPLHCYVYVATPDCAYILFTISPESSEPDSLASVARSFKVVKDSDVAKARATKRTALKATPVLLVAVLAVVFILRRKRR